MRKFIKKLLFYSIACTIVLSAMALAIDNGLHKVNDDMYGDWNRLFSKSINDDIIVIGNSRAKVHFDPLIIEEITGYSCYNLGKDATNLFLQQPVINSVLNNSKPKYILLSLDIGSFQQKNEIFGKEQYLPYLDKPYIHQVLSEVDNKVKIERYLPLVKYRGQFEVITNGLKSLVSPIDTYSLNKGFFGWDREWNSDFDNFKKIMGKNKVMLSDSEIEEGLMLLTEIILKCRENGVKVILCQTPKYKELYSYFPQKKEVDDKIEKLAKRYELVYFDFSYHKMHENRNLFYNASHLNLNGANMLTREFSILFNERVN